MVRGKSGGRSRARTYDPLIKSQLLYQLSYTPAKREAGYVASSIRAVQGIILRLVRAAWHAEGRKRQKAGDSLSPAFSTPMVRGNLGGRSRARTYDPLIKSQLLYQLSYTPRATRGRLCNKTVPGCPAVFSNILGGAAAADDDVAVDMHA